MNILVTGKDISYARKLVDYLNLLDGITAGGITADFKTAACGKPFQNADLVILDIESIGKDTAEILRKLATLETVRRILVLTVHPESEAVNLTGISNKIIFQSKDNGIDSVLEVIRNGEFDNE